VPTSSLVAVLTDLDAVGLAMVSSSGPGSASRISLVTHVSVS